MTEYDWSAIRNRLKDPAGMHVKERQEFSYIDARQVMDRLDDVVGPQNWATEFHVIDPTAFAVECRLTVLGVTKADVGYCNNPGQNFEKEPFKAAYSDAFKRAAVHFGVGRFLYEDTPQEAPKRTTSPRSTPTSAPAASAEPPAPMPQQMAIPPRRDQPAQLNERAILYLCAAEVDGQPCGKSIEPVTYTDKGGQQRTQSAAQRASFTKVQYGVQLCTDHARQRAEVLKGVA